MEIALNTDTPGGFKHENAVTSQNGLALLASITLKNALNINNNNNNNNTTKDKNNITKNKNNNNDLSLNHSNRNNIKHHKASQPQHGFISSPQVASLSSATVATNELLSTSLSTSSPSNTLQQQLQEEINVFTFTTAGLEALTPPSTLQTDTGAVAVDQRQQQNKKLQASTTADLSSSSKKNNNHHTSLSTNQHFHHQTNNTLSAKKESSVALLEALSIKASKKQQNVPNPNQQQKLTVKATSTTTTTIPTSLGNNNNNNSNNSHNNGNGNNGSSNKHSFRIPSDILDDLASRFIINVPDMELSNLIRICFQIELAHWFYLDFFCASEEEKKLQPCGIKQFALQMFEHIPFLRQHLSTIDKVLEDWKNYKLSVPTYGAILISEDLNYCLLVQSYFAKSSWGFPKGKVNENEDPVHCATREVYEETGYDITDLIVPNDFIEAVINYQYTRLYIVRDVSLETKFSPRTRNEIKCCDWFPIDALPVNKNDAISKPKLGINANSFFMIMPFVKRLKKWVNDKRNGVETRHKYSSGGTPTSTSPLTIAIAMNGQLKSITKKQQKRNNAANNFNDDTNALNNGGGSGSNGAALSNFSCVNNTNSNRSKRQRHKSMGDLDGIKLNNFNNCNNNKTNCKSTNNNNNNNNNSNSATTTTASSSSATTTANNGGNVSCNNINTNNNNNQNRHTKIVAAGSNVSNNINNNTNNGCNNNNNNNNNNNHINGNNISSKRQLFQSQSQTNNLQQTGEKIFSSFDLIRKEKQQIKAALAKTQKQQQNVNNNSNNNNNNSGRQRAKSQSDKMCMQQQKQQLQQQQQKSSGSGINNKQQQRIQKQQSLIVTNSNMQNYNNSSNSSKNHNNSTNNANGKSNVNNNYNNNTMTSGGYKTSTTPPLNGHDLLASAGAAANVTPVAHKTTTTTTTAATPQQVTKSGAGVEGICDQPLKPRPSSVALHFPEISLIKGESGDITKAMATATNNKTPQFQGMASGTNLRILKRSTSHQPTTPQQTLQQQQQQPPQRQASALQFTPNFNSWTNFTFTKNFIANVFC